MKSSVKQKSWFSLPALALITLGSACGKNAQEEAFQAQPEQVQVEIILKDRRVGQKSLEEAPAMPSMTNAMPSTQWGQGSQTGAQQLGRYGAASTQGPGYGGFGGGFNRPRTMGLGGPGVGGSLAGDPNAANRAAGAGMGAPTAGVPGGMGSPLGGGFAAGVGGPLGGSFGGPGGIGGFDGAGGFGGIGGFGGGPGFAGPGVPFGPGPYGVFEPALMPYQPFVVEDVVGDWGDDDGCDRRGNNRRKGCKKEGRDRDDRDNNLKTTNTGHVLEQ
jgi:hypothetical protein